MPADNKLLTQWLYTMKQDREAFASLYAEMSRPMYTVACRILHNRADAEDAVQDAFLKLLRKDNIEEISNGRAYILQTVRNEALMMLRRRSHEELQEEVAADVREDSPDSFAWENEAAIAEAIESLEATERDIFTLHVNGELSFEEIAGVMDMSLSAVYRRYRKAQKKLRKMMNGGNA
ncbi:MAG: sigma-70 family RNA polymerase sigma factor [Lachnospiraceae bacterium]|nr:sigma-70 family RNA polymerase sigma factor [Lachnospiraceae bacterium]